MSKVFLFGEEGGGLVLINHKTWVFRWIWKVRSPNKDICIPDITLKRIPLLTAINWINKLNLKKWKSENRLKLNKVR